MIKTPTNSAAEAMGFEPDAAIDITDSEKHPTSRDGSCFHRHVAIEWEGGVLWLDMSVQSDHYCVDVREFVPAQVIEAEGVELAGLGTFTIVNGRRAVLASGRGELNDDPLLDPDGTPVKGHGWNAGYVITLMHDKQPSKNQTNQPGES